jgi:hypothetical protein
VAPSNHLVGWKDELGLIGLEIATVGLLVTAFYVPINSQVVLFGVGIVALLTASFAIWLYVKLLNWFDVRFRRLPSTWLMLLNLVLLVAFAISSGEKPLIHHPSNIEAAFLGGMLLCCVTSLATNVQRTSFLFGVSLTFAQILYSVLAIVGFFFWLLGQMAKHSLERGNKNKSTSNTGSTQNNNTQDDMDRIRMF